VSEERPTNPNPPGPEPRSFVTSRPVAVLMLFIAAVVFGWFSFGQLPVTLMPELSYPTLTVRTEYPGAAPEEVENDISRPIEEALGVIGGLQKISSVSRAEVSDVILEFSWDIDVSDATQDVLEKLDLVFLPDESKRPLILHFDPSLDPIMELSLSGSGVQFEGEAGQRRLRRLADLQIKRQLEPIKGVAAIKVKGGLEEEIHVWLVEDQLRRTGISIQTVIDRLAQENINLAGGTIQEGRTEYLVRTLNEYQDLDQMRDTIVTSIEGRDVRLRDLGEVRMSHKERQILTRTDGGESVQIEIYKEADANIVALAQRVKFALGEIREEDTEGPGGDDIGLAQQIHESEGARLSVVADRSLFIESSINEVRNTAILGGLLAILVLFLFLRNFKTTMIVAVSIPISLLITFAPLNLMEVTLNIMSLGGLALGIGMLVDSSIVVLESIHRCREEGDGLVAAAVRGAEEVRSAVIASTLTSIAVFFPMVFVEGVAGQAFGDLGMAVVVSLLASMAVAVYFIPMLASRQGFDVRSLGGANQAGAGPRLRRFESWMGLVAEFRGKSAKIVLVKTLTVVPLVYFLVRFVVHLVLELVAKLVMVLFMALTFLTVKLLAPGLRVLFRVLSWVFVWITDRILRFLHATYPPLLRWTVANPLPMLLIVAVTVWGSWQIASSLGSELLPEVRQGEFTVEVTLPVGTPLHETEAILAPIEAAILEETDSIDSVLLTVGYDPAQSDRSDEGEHTARFKILLEAESGSAVEDQVVDRLRDRFAGIPDLESRITRPVLFSSKTPIEVEIHGDDLTQLRRYSDEVRAVMETMPELADVQATLQSGAPEIQVVYDRARLMRYGLNIGQVARLVRDKVQGYEATRFNLLDRRVPIVVRLTESDRETVEHIRGMEVNPGGERPIPLESVATVVLGEGPSEVRRIDGRRVAVVAANIGQGSMGAAVDAIDKVLASRIDWPSGMTFLISGQNEEWERSEGSLILALGLSIFLVYVIMAIQFESLVHPLVIMFSIPLAFIGTVVGLKILDIPLSVVVFLGMIMLAGIVVNNAIVLMDYINQLRRRGLELTEAIVEAGSVRLRPILMTTATTVLGLLPMAMGLGDGAEIRTPMAIAVISGLLSSTFLTLLVIPTLYALMDNLVARLLGRRTLETPASPRSSVAAPSSGPERMPS